MPKPTLVVVSGPPRSGTREVAHAIGERMPCPVICRDEIKEGMVHASGTDYDPAAGDDLNQPTLAVFLEALRMMVMAEVTVVAEAAFQDRLWRSGLEPLADLARLRIVQCHVDPAIARERREAAAKAGSGRFHTRIIGDDIDDWKQAFASFERLSLAAASIDVDTTHALAPDLGEIVRFINHPSAPGPVF
jgi:predicted kinase